MDIERLHYLIEIDRCRSITHASECLYISVQQLRRVLNSIEKEYNVQIFDRNNNGLKPTIEGELFLQEVKKLLKQDELMHSLPNAIDQSQMKGKLTIFASPNVWSKDQNCISKFVSDYPNIHVKQYIRGSQIILQKTKETPESVGMFISWGSKEESDKTRESLKDEYEVYPLTEIPLAVYYSRKHPLARKNRSVSLRRLATEPNVVFKPYEEQSYELVKLFDNKGIQPPEIKYEVSDKTLLFKILHETDSVFIAGQIADTKRSDELCSNLIEENIIARHDLIVHKSWAESTIIKTFVKNAIAYYENLI